RARRRSDRGGPAATRHRDPRRRVLRGRLRDVRRLHAAVLSPAAPAAPREHTEPGTAATRRAAADDVGRVHRAATAATTTTTTTAAAVAVAIAVAVTV